MLVVKSWAKLVFIKNLIEVLQQMNSVTPKELHVWEDGLDVIVSNSSRAFEIHYRPFGEAGEIHAVEVDYVDHKVEYGGRVIHNIDNMKTVMNQLNQYFGLLEE